jgi:hypothetical protein
MIATATILADGKEVDKRLEGRGDLVEGTDTVAEKGNTVTYRQSAS